MIRSSIGQNVKLLIISPNANIIAAWLNDIIKQYHVQCYASMTGMTGVTLFTKCQPNITVIDCELKDVKGLSLASLIKGTDHGDKNKVILINIGNLIGNSRADFFIFCGNTPYSDDVRMALYSNIHIMIDDALVKRNHSDEIERAKQIQRKNLPEPIVNNRFRVANFFSPLRELSGDGLDFWVGNSDEGIYGFLFDCTGHDITSFTEGGGIRTLLKKSCKMHQHGFLQRISEILEEVNNDFFEVDSEPPITPAIVFYISFKDNVMRYCSAGIPCILVKYFMEKDYQRILSENLQLGMLPGGKFDESELPLHNVEEIVISSDGFSELFAPTLPKPNEAKHDDASAIIISLKRDVVYSEKSIKR